MRTEPLNPEPSLAVRRIRRSRTAVALADGAPFPVRFIIDGRDGALVFPAPHAIRDAHEVVLWTPEERFDADQIAVERREITGVFDEAKDRHLAYHGSPQHPIWLACAVSSARVDGHVFDADDLALANAIRGVEPRLCKALNADRARLAGLCHDMLRVRPEAPLAVGVDEDGIDVRAAFGILRLELPRRAADAGDAEAMIRGLLSPAL